MIGIDKIIFEYNDKLLIINVGRKCSVTYNNVTKDVDVKVIWNYLQTFTKIILDWEDEYIDNNIIGGSSWRLIINYINFKKEYLGKGIYPSNFQILENINFKLINEVFNDEWN